MATGSVSRTTPVMPTGVWKVDAVHSSVSFSVKHMGIANVRGRFTEIEGTLEVREDLAEGRIQGTVKVASIETGDAKRDEHLRSADFFDVERFPEISFESTRIEAIDEERTRVTGNLAMHGVAREIVLEGQTEGTDTDPWGNTRVGVEGFGKLLRSDFEMKFNQALSSGNKLVGDKVTITLDISAVLQPS